MASPPPGWVWQGTWQDGRWYGQWVPGPGMSGPGMSGPGISGPGMSGPGISGPGISGPGMSGAAYGPAGTYVPPRVIDADMQRMIDRCRDYRHDSGVAGAVVGGIVGGVVGNRVVSGDRVAGTLGGAALGAVAGGAIDHAGKRRRDRECEAFFADHPDYAPGGAAYGPPPGVPPQPGAAGVPMAYGVPMTYGVPMAYATGTYATMPMAPAGYMMMPVQQGGQIPQAPQAPCVETKTVTTEYVDAPRHRLMRAKPHAVAPRRKEKRVYTGS